MSHSNVALPLSSLTQDTNTAKTSLAPSSRMIKLSAAALSCILGAYGLLNESQFVATSDAVMSAYVLDVRTPTEGTVTDLPLTAGDFVHDGQVLGRVDNPLADHQHLDNLHITEEVARSNADSLTEEQATLEQQRSMLTVRAGQYTAAVRERLQHQVSEAVFTLSARREELAEADLELSRGRALHSVGIISNAAFDKVSSTQNLLTQEVRASEAQYAVVEAQQSAAKRGVLSEPGTNSDVTYSLQRADELSMKLAENARALASALAQARQAHLAVEAETRRDALLGTTELRAPSSGELWNLAAVNGEHVSSGAAILSLVDCSRQFLIADIPQDRIGSVVRNGRAYVKLSGETTERTGTVMTVSGDSSRDLNVKLAAKPLHNSYDSLATAVIRLDPVPGQKATSSACLVGRGARVRIPTTRTNILTHWIAERI